MAKAFSSITITEVNDGQNGTTLVWKGSYASVANLIEAQGSPKNGWAYYDIGLKGSYIYQDGSWFLLSQDGLDGDGANQIVDIRYSDNLNDKHFTTNDNGEEDGLTLGKYIGFRLVEKKPTIEELQGTFDDYSWSSLETTVDFNLSFYIKTSVQIINHQVNKDNVYACTPDEIEIEFYAEANAERIVLNKDLYCFDINFYYEDGSIDNKYIKEDLSESTLELSLSDINQKINQIDIILYEKRENIGINEDGQEQVSIIYKIQASSNIIGIYEMTKELAIFQVNADSIVQSIGETKLTFSDKGLTVANGALTILDKNSVPVFYTVDGDLVLKGTIYAENGEFGGWVIKKEEFSSSNNKTIFYSGAGMNYHGSSARILTGLRETQSLVEDDEELNYSFIVTDNGYLYCADANITGDIHAINGSILNFFKIGTEDSFRGITIYGGNNENDSYIGSNNFSSGTFGYGWNISGSGTAEFTDIRARGKISSSVFEYQKTSSIGGNLYITPTIYFEQASSPIKTENGNFVVTLTHSSSDIKGISGRAWKEKDEIRLEGIAVLESNKNQVILNNVVGYIQKIEVINNETNIEVVFENEKSLNDYILIEGTLLMFYGAWDEATQKIQQSGIYLTASEEASPYIDVYDISTDGKVKYSPAVRLGNLSGVRNDIFGTETGYLEGFGLYSSNAYLTGELILPNAGITNQQKVGYDGLENYTSIKEDNSNAIRIWAGAEKPKADSGIIAPFIVTQDGSLYAKKGVFQGTVIAENGYFNGVIQAAGIILDKNTDYTSPEIGKDHFFVGYSQNPVSFDDYVLNIGKDGISIWEGALRAFSDFASISTNEKYTHKIYGYDNTQKYTPLPYFFLVDAVHNITSEGLSLDNRVVNYKNHIFQLDEKYQWSSVLLDNGIWFSSGTNEDFILQNNLDTLEKKAYESHGKIGIYEKENKLNIRSEEIILENEDIYFNGYLHLNNNSSNDISISIGNMLIQEVDSTIEGINFI